MRLIGSYLKIILLRHKLNYLWIILSIIAVFTTMTMMTVYIDNFLSLSKEGKWSNLQSIYVCLRTVFIMGGFFFVISQYNQFIKIGIRVYGILRVLGATKKDLRYLSILQLTLLIILTIPLGLFSGYFITDHMLKLISNFIYNEGSISSFDSTYLLMIGTIAASGTIIAIGIIMERGLRKLSWSNKYSTYPVSKGVLEIW